MTEHQTVHPEPHLRFEDKGPETIKYGLMDSDDTRIGMIELRSSPVLGQVSIEHIGILDDYQGRGYGKRLYKTVPHLPLSDGSRIIDGDLRFVSSSTLLSDARRVWDSLVDEGVATRHDDGSYEMVSMPIDEMAILSLIEPDTK